MREFVEKTDKGIKLAEKYMLENANPAVPKEVVDFMVESAKKRLEKVNRYNRVATPDVRTYQLGEEPELLHIIKTGFEDKYIVCYEDAYELELGKLELLSKKEILEKFNIDLK